MINATVRHRLTRDDAQLVARLIARDSATPLEEIERKLADEGIDAVLDDPRKIEYAKMARVTRLMVELGRAVANSPQRPR